MGKRRERVNLRDGTARKAQCEPGEQQTFYRDIEQRGLALRVTAGGNRAYVYEGKLNGGNIRVTIGDPVNVTIKEARIKAAEIRQMILQGRDPRVIKAERTAADTAKRAKAKADAAPAVEAWQAYLKARTSHWSARTLLDHERLAAAGGEPRKRGKGLTQAGPLRDLLFMPLAKIDAPAIAAWLEAQGDRPAVAQFAFARLRAFLNWCAARPGYQADPQACQKRIVTDLVPSIKTRSDVLERQHLAAWFEAVRRLPAVPAAFLQVCLLTGARRSEVACLQWSDLDFTWRTIRLDGKTGERVIPMPPYVGHLLADLQKAGQAVVSITGQKPATSPWVFPSPSASGHIIEPRSSHDKALAAAGLPHVSIHGLRRSFGSLSQWCDLPAGVIEQIQGHAPQGTAERHYRVRPVDLLAKWHTEYEGWILAQAGIEQPAEAKRKSITAA